MDLRANLPKLTVANAAQNEYTNWTDEQTITTAQDNIAPSAPTLTANAGDQEIALVLAAPATDADGNPNRDFDHFKVYYKLSSGVTTGESSITTKSTHHSFPASAQTYFKAAAVDRWGNESVLSAEDDATPTSAAPEVTIGDITNISNIVVGDGMIGIILATPSTSWVGFSHWELEYDVQVTTYVPASASWTALVIDSKIGYIHKDLDKVDGSSNPLLYAYRARAVGEDGTVNTYTIDNNATSGYAPTQTSNANIIAQDILAQNIVATNEIRGNHIYAGSTITISGSGYIASSNYSAGSAGFKILGDGSAEFNNVTVRGAIHASSGTFSGTITASGTISGGTITGAKIQTAASGHRVVMLDTTYLFNAYKSGDASPFFYIDAANRIVALQLTGCVLGVASGRAYIGANYSSGYTLEVSGANAIYLGGVSGSTYANIKSAGALKLIASGTGGDVHLKSDADDVLLEAYDDIYMTINNNTDTIRIYGGSETGAVPATQDGYLTIEYDDGPGTSYVTRYIPFFRA